ncbi:response regulator transcription factor [Planctomycetaceae bacterium SH139]
MDRSVVYIVEDDATVRQTLVWMLESEQLIDEIEVKSFATPGDLLSQFDPQSTGCLILDLRLPEMSGLELRDALVDQGCELPFIVITGSGGVPDVISAMRQGAIDFIEKPLKAEQLCASVRRAIAKDAQRRSLQQSREKTNQLLDSLTRREREVLELVVAGLLNKQIARELNLSIKTIESHRANIMKKLAAESVAQLVRMVVENRE